MNKVIFLVCALFVFPAMAHAGKCSTKVYGQMVGAEVSGLMGDAGMMLFGKRVWKYWGLDGGMGFQHVEEDSSGTLKKDVTKLRMGLGSSLGYAWKRYRPYVRMGFVYEDHDKNGWDKNLFIMEPSLGVDVRVGCHLVMGFQVVSIPVVIDGDLNGEDRGGESIHVFNSFSLSYLF